MKHKVFVISLLCASLIAASQAQTQAQQAPADQPSAPTPPTAPRPRRIGMRGMPMGMPMDGMPMGKWWKNAEIVKELQLSDDQLQRLEKTFQDSRLHLIDLHAALQKEEAQLEPLIQSDNPDESQVDA